jgi:hypothetical protein
MMFGTGKTALRTVLARALMPPLPKGVQDDRPTDLSLMPDRTVDEYMKRVRDRWEVDALPDRRRARELAKRRHLNYLRALRAAGVAKNSHAIARIEANLRELEGTAAPKVVHVAGEGGGPIQTESRVTVLTSGERRARAAQLLAQTKARAAAAVEQAVAAASEEE